MIRIRKVAPSDVREYAGYLTESVKEEAGYAASASGPRRGDYYLGTPGEPHAEPLGVWGGRGAELIGLRGEVEREPLERVWEGRHPTTGDPTIRPGANGEHVPAIDIVVSVPKSVSEAWALEPDPARRALIEAGVTRATEAVMAVMEATCPLVARRVDGRMVREPAGGLVWSRFRHHTARTTDEQTARGNGADPDLHDHVVVANYAVRQDGRVGAIDSYAAMRWQRVFTQLHYGQLAREMHRLGYETVRAGDQFELAGASREGIDEFSSRSDAIDRATAEFRATYGRHPTPAEHQQIVRSTRRGKDANPLGDRERWVAREATLEHRALPRGIEAGAKVRPVGMATINERARLRDERGGAGRELRTTEQITADVLREITTGERRLSREAAVFDTQELHLAVARALVGRDGADIHEQYGRVLEAVMGSGELVRLDREHWTTRRHRELERAVLEAARARATPAERGALFSSPAAPPQERVEWHIAHARVPLDAEQQAAVRELCADRGLWMVLAEGGTGKGEVARVVADIYREQGYRVIAVSTAAQRAQEFGRDLGADEARSIDSLVHSCSRGFGLGARTLVLADEVGQADTYRWADLLRAVGEAPIRGFGDTEQLDSVEAGGMLRVLERELGAAPLRNVYRTRDEELIALWRRVRAGDRSAVDELDRRGALIFVDSLPQAREEVVSRWDAARRAGEQLEGRRIRDFLMATNISNRQVDQLNQLAQQRRLERGEIVGPSVEVVFEDERTGYRRAERLYTGDHVRLVAGGKVGEDVVRNGQVGRVVSVGEDGSAVVDIEGRREEMRRRMEVRQQQARERFEQRTEAIRRGFEREQAAARCRHAQRGIAGARVEEWQRAARTRFEQCQAEGRQRFEARQESLRGEFVAGGEGGTVRFGPRELPLLRLSYAGHDQTTQGRTSQTLDGLIGREGTDRQSAYVELSRARTGARFHVALDQWQVPRERVVEPATAERAAVVEAIPWEERVAMAKERVAEAFARARPKVAALEHEARLLGEHVREQERWLVRERAAIARDSASPATARQLYRARAVGVEVPEGASWVEASVAIERATGAEPGTFAREALSERHSAARVDELLDQVLSRPEAMDAVGSPPVHAGQRREAGWRDVAWVRAELVEGGGPGAPRLEEAGAEGPAQEIRRRSTDREDGPASDLRGSEASAAAPREPAASLSAAKRGHGRLEGAPAVRDAELSELRDDARAEPEVGGKLAEGRGRGLVAGAESAEASAGSDQRRLTLADLEAAEQAYLAELGMREAGPSPSGEEARVAEEHQDPEVRRSAPETAEPEPEPAVGPEGSPSEPEVSRVAEAEAERPPEPPVIPRRDLDESEPADDPWRYELNLDWDDDRCSDRGMGMEM